MSTVLFTHNHRFTEIDNEYYSGGNFPKSIWKRYSNHFDEIIVLGRKDVSNKTNRDNLTLSSDINVSFELLDYLESPINFYRYSSRIRKDIKKTIIKHNVKAVIARIPSGLSYKAIDVCKKMNIPYAVEIVGCPFDTTYNYKFDPWYHYGNFGVKPLAYLAKIRMRAYVKGARFAIYVTKSYLQNRYPTHSAFTASVSDVQLPDQNVKVLEHHKELLVSDKEHLKFGMIGNKDVYYKGYDIALRALALVKLQLPPFKIYFVGGGSGNAIQKLAKELNLSDNIRFVGRLESGSEVFDFLNTLDLYLHPSRTEGMPRSLIEAMGNACPCLASKAGGIPELLDDSFLHEVGDYRTLANQILELTESKRLKILAAENNFFKAKEYTVEVLTERRNEFWNVFHNSLND